MSDKKVFKVTDDVVIIVRELVQLSLLTGTSMVDHLRAMQLVEDAGRPGYLTLDEAYVRSYNEYITSLEAQAREAQAKMQATEAQPSTEV